MKFFNYINGLPSSVKVNASRFALIASEDFQAKRLSVYFYLTNCTVFPLVTTVRKHEGDFGYSCLLAVLGMGGRMVGSKQRGPGSDRLQR